MRGEQSARSLRRRTRVTITRVTWIAAQPLDTARFRLEPLTVEHAAEMVDVLAPEDLYLFTGGEPPSEENLRARYARQAAGSSPDGSEGWVNWVVRDPVSRRAIGFVQATLSVVGDTTVADLAWLIAPTAQGNGAAVESAAAVLAWLRAHRVSAMTASIRPGHDASERVARRLGLMRTSRFVDGESVWETRSADTDLERAIVR